MDIARLIRLTYSVGKRHNNLEQIEGDCIKVFLSGRVTRKMASWPMFRRKKEGEQMKPKFGGSGTLYLTVIIITAFLTGGCGVSGGGGSSGGGGGGGGGTTTGTPPDINVSASQLLFGGIVFNSGIDLKNFADRTITIQNKGTLDLNIGQIAWADPLAPPFRITTDNCSMQTLASLQTCTFQVRFAPTDQGSFNDTFDIPSNDPDENPVTVTVSGDGKGLNVSINQVSTNCPNPSPTVTLYITVSDEDGDPLAPLLTKANFSLFENSVPIAPGDIVFKDPSTLDLPKSIALVLDISASMDLRDAITAMQAAAVDFIDQLDFNPPDPDEAEIIRFAKSIEPVPAPVFTSNAVTLKAAINADPKINPVDFRDGTAMYDAVERAVPAPGGGGDRRRPGQQLLHRAERAHRAGA